MVSTSLEMWRYETSLLELQVEEGSRVSSTVGVIVGGWEEGPFGTTFGHFVVIAPNMVLGLGPLEWEAIVMDEEPEI